MTTISRRTATLALAAVLASGVTLAQAPGVKRTQLQRIDIGNNMEVIMGIAEIAPGGVVGRHTHFGIEAGYTLAGSASLEIAGEGVRLLSVGDSYVIPNGKVHDARTIGDAPARVLAVYVVEKGKPFATPAQ